jgi:hypothetical protein
VRAGFHRWLLSQFDRSDLVGDLARYGHRHGLPRTDSLPILLAHLRHVDAPKLLDAARAAHSEWSRASGKGRARTWRHLAGDVDAHGNIVGAQREEGP